MRWSSSVTSQARPTARPPACVTPSAAARALAASRSVTATAAPAAAKVSAMARPIPAPAPVTRATCPSSRKCASIVCAACCCPLPSTSKRGSATLGSIVGNPQHPGAACLWPGRRRRLTMAGPSARFSNLLLQPLFADLAVEGGAADAQTTGDLRHVAGIDLDGVLDQVAFDFLEGADMAAFIGDADRA